MPRFNISAKTNSLVDFSWTLVKEYRIGEFYDENKERIVQSDHQGRKYRLIKYTRETPALHKIGYLLLAIFTLGLCLKAKPIRNALIKGIETKRFGISVQPFLELPSVPNQSLESSPYLDLAPKTFVDKIFASDLYTQAEKDKLISVAESVYDDQGKPISPTSWAWSTTTKDYLDALANKHPQFRTLPIVEEQIVDKEFDQAKIDTVLEVLPKDLTNLSHRPSIFGHAIQVSGNHRTAFIIDLEHGRVEYYNSFGSDSSLRKALTQVAECLTRKYGKNFSYHHKTAGTNLQTEGYNCGIWTCKFIKERIEKGVDYIPKSVEKTEMAEYRTSVFNKVFKYKFYGQIGRDRLNEHLKNEHLKNEHDEYLKKDSKFIEKFQESDFHRRHIRYRLQYFYNIKTEYANWCKTGKMPVSLSDAIQEIQKIQLKVVTLNSFG